MIRMQSAVDLCESLSFNKTLTFLDLSYNTIGSEGGTKLGRALLTNRSLTELHLKSNMIDPVACFTLCVGARECLSLTYLDVDCNPIGDAGGRILMTIPLICGSRLHVSAKECDFLVKSKQIILNRRDPVGKYELNLASDYGRAVLFDILDVVANHPSLVIKGFALSLENSGNWENIRLKKVPIKRSYMGPREIKEIENQKFIIKVSQNEDHIVELFNKYDEDGSGELNFHEFVALMNEFGISLTEKEV